MMMLLWILMVLLLLLLVLTVPILTGCRMGVLVVLGLRTKIKPPFVVVIVSVGVSMGAGVGVLLGGVGLGATEKSPVMVTLAVEKKKRKVVLPGVLVVSVGVVGGG